MLSIVFPSGALIEGWGLPDSLHLTVVASGADHAVVRCAGHGAKVVLYMGPSANTPCKIVRVWFSADVDAAGQVASAATAEKLHRQSASATANVQHT